MSICKTCRYEMKAWAKQFREKWIGCGVLVSGEYRELDHASVEDTAYKIDAKQVAVGWISNGKMAFNDQILTEGTRRCPFFRARSF